MPSHAAARRRAPAHRRAEPQRFPRRVSGPARPAAAIALPAPRRGTTGVFERIRALPDYRVVDRILRGRACIVVIALLLGGIVAMQVSLLKLNASISQSIERAGALERMNADLETDVAQLASGERIQEAAVKEGMVSPSAGDLGFLRARPKDVRLAARRMTAPSDDARAVMAARGYTSAATLTATGAVTPAPTGVATPAPTPVATPVPTATATPAPVVTAVPTPPPAVTAAPATASPAG